MEVESPNIRKNESTLLRRHSTTYGSTPPLSSSRQQRSSFKQRRGLSLVSSAQRRQEDPSSADRTGLRRARESRTKLRKKSLFRNDYNDESDQKMLLFLIDVRTLQEVPKHVLVVVVLRVMLMFYNRDTKAAWGYRFYDSLTGDTPRKVDEQLSSSTKDCHFFRPLNTKQVERFQAALEKVIPRETETQTESSNVLENSIHQVMNEFNWDHMNQFVKNGIFVISPNMANLKSTSFFERYTSYCGLYWIDSRFRDEDGMEEEVSQKQDFYELSQTLLGQCNGGAMRLASILMGNGLALPKVNELERPGAVKGGETKSIILVREDAKTTMEIQLVGEVSGIAENDMTSLTLEMKCPKSFDLFVEYDCDNSCLCSGGGARKDDDEAWIQLLEELIREKSVGLGQIGTTRVMLTPLNRCVGKIHFHYSSGNVKGNANLFGSMRLPDNKVIVQGCEENHSFSFLNYVQGNSGAGKAVHGDENKLTEEQQAFCNQLLQEVLPIVKKELENVNANGEPTLETESMNNNTHLETSSVSDTKPVPKNQIGETSSDCMVVDNESNASDGENNNNEIKNTPAVLDENQINIIAILENLEKDKCTKSVKTSFFQVGMNLSKPKLCEFYFNHLVRKFQDKLPKTVAKLGKVFDIVLEEEEVPKRKKELDENNDKAITGVPKPSPVIEENQNENTTNNTATKTLFPTVKYTTTKGNSISTSTTGSSSTTSSSNGKNKINAMDPLQIRAKRFTLNHFTTSMTNMNGLFSKRQRLAQPTKSSSSSSSSATRCSSSSKRQKRSLATTVAETPSKFVGETPVKKPRRGNESNVKKRLFGTPSPSAKLKEMNFFRDSPPS